MRLFRKKKQSKATVAAEKTEPTLIIEASDNQPEALKREILPTFIAFLRDITRLEENTQRKSQILEREKLEDGLSDFARTPEIEKLWIHYHEQFESWLPLFVPLSYYNVVMPKPLRLRHDFITSTTVVAYRLHFLMSIPSKL